MYPGLHYNNTIYTIYTKQEIISLNLTLSQSHFSYTNCADCMYNDENIARISTFLYKDVIGSIPLSPNFDWSLISDE